MGEVGRQRDVDDGESSRIGRKRGVVSKAYSFFFWSGFLRQNHSERKEDKKKSEVPIGGCSSELYLVHKNLHAL